MDKFLRGRVAASLLPLAAALALAGCGKDLGAAQAAAQAPAPAVPVSVQQVAPGNVDVAYEYVGQSAGSREVEVRARVGGILQKRMFTEGQPVRQGDPLFQIDPAPFQIALEQAVAALRDRQAELTRAQQNYDRVQPLFRENALSRKDFDEAAANREAARAQVMAAQAKVKEAQINLGYTRVSAPISGLTSREVRSEGSLVGGSADASMLTKISQNDPIYVNFNVPEADLDALRGQQSSGALKFHGGGFKVSLRLSDGSRFERSGSLNFTDHLVDASTGTVRLRASLANPDGRILPGQFVTVLLQGAYRAQAIAIPQRAVLTSQQGKAVWVVGADNRVQLRPVEAGQEQGLNVLINKGLKAGDRVALDNLVKLRPGALVQISPEPAATGASSRS